MRKNRSFVRKMNKGYTLAEMLIVVAIMVILLGISILAILGYRENLKMAELDDHAKIIYLEAQDQLGIVEVEGALGSYQKDIRNTYPASGTDKRFLKEIYPLNTYVSDYPIVSVSNEEKEQALKMWDNMCYLTKDDTLATKLISHTSDIYTNGGSYLIEFNPKTGDIYGVFYWESDTTISYDTDVLTLSSRNRSDRKATKIGYYGGAIAGDLEEEKNLGEKVTLYNGEELYLKISFKNTGELVAPYSNLRFVISITGESNNTVTFDDVDLNENVEINHETIDFYMLLDSMYTGFQFNDIVNAGKPEGEQVITPGENLTIKVNTEFTDAGGNVLKNVNTVHGNSLFANDTNDDYLSISALRHMVNLNRDVYNANMFANRNTVQYISDVDFEEDAYSWELNLYNRAIRKEYGTAVHPKINISPIKNDTLFKSSLGGNRKVTGKNASSKYVLRNFIVAPNASQTENVGIFGEVQGVDFSNIYVEDIRVNAENCDNVGSLIGYMKNGSITECGVYLATYGEVGGVITDFCKMMDANGTCHTDEMAHRYDTDRVKGKNNVGGLVGKAEAVSSVKISKAFAAIKTEGVGSYVGGLIGYANITGATAPFRIEYSYASGDTIGQEYVGGFAGGVVAEGTNRAIVKDNYSTGNVYGTKHFGGFIGKTKNADYTECISYGEVCKFGVEEGKGHGLAVGDTAGGFVYDGTDTNIDSTYTDTVYMGQIGFNKNAVLKTPSTIDYKDYAELLSQNTDTAVPMAYPYNEELYMLDFPFKKIEDASARYEQKTHYGNWPKKFIIDTSLVYYERYADGSYGYYCVTTVTGNDMIWLLDTLKEETCVEDGYGLMTKYNLESVGYDLYVGNQSQDGAPTVSGVNVPIVYREDVEGTEYSEAFVYLNQQGRLTFHAAQSYDAATGTVVPMPAGKEDSFEVKGLYLYQLPYDLQCTNRKGVPYFYDRIVFNATAKGGLNKVVIEELSYFYCPHFAKTAYNPNVSSDPIDLTSTDAVPNPTNVYVRSARQLNALGRFHYYWNTRHGYEGQKINYIQETDINFSTYVKTYAGKEFDLQAFDKPYSNRAIGNSELSAVGETDYAGAFKNNYDGRSHKIIDFCLSSSDIQFVGLFGEIQDAILQNIVMVMSSEPASPNAGLITSNFKTWMTLGDDSRRREMRASVGALLGMAYDNTYCDDFSNTIENCVAAGYTVEFVVQEDANPTKPLGSTDLDPLGIVIGGLIGYGESDITNCAAVNDVVIRLEKDYTNNFSYWYYYAQDNVYKPLEHPNEGGIVNMGGFVGSYIYNKIENCYSGGSIRVIDNGYTIPHLRVGNFCAGWLDTRAYGLSYDDWKRAEKEERICSCGRWCSRNTKDFKAMEYVDCYTYTTVSDTIWDVSSKTMTYVPFASSKVDYFNRITDKYNGVNMVRSGNWTIGDSIPNNHTTYENNYYIDMVANLEKADAKQLHGDAVTCDQLEGMAVDKAKVSTTFLNADTNAGKAYPYEAVVTDVNTGEYVHYGDWFKVSFPESVLTYYERYADGSYGYYCVTADKYGEDAWVLDTLKDEVCVEDGYGLFSKHQLSTLSYTKGGASSQCSLERISTKGPLRFRAYETYNEVLGKGDTDLKESLNVERVYVYLYKLPYAVQDPGNPSAFYNEIVFNGTVGGAKVIDGFKAWYNPHFAKAALNPVKDTTYSTPTNVFVRSARQLNALGRNTYYWGLRGSSTKNERVSYIQETDINFSTYTKNYMGQEFDLQAFGKSYSNHTIGMPNGYQFKNIYDGRGNAIIDYCVDGGTDVQFTGLFGEINEATIKNIVMLVSSEPKGNGGIITSSFRTQKSKKNIPHLNGLVMVEKQYLYRAGVGALVGLAYEGNPSSESTNTIANCVVSGYTVQYMLKNDTTELDPLGVAVGGLVGFSMSEISNCTVTNHVVMNMEKNYANVYNQRTGIVHLGGFVGSQMYNLVKNSYSGGSIDIVNNGNYRAPILRVGGFCPGWLDTMVTGKLYYANTYRTTAATDLGRKVGYQNVYSYTKVSDAIWNASASTDYVPLVSTVVSYGNGETWTTATISTDKMLFEDNIYIEEVTAHHLEKASDAVKAYYMKDGVNFTGMRKSLLGLGTYAKENGLTVTVTDDTTNTFINGDTDSKGNLIASKEAFPYIAVVNGVDVYGNVVEGKFVHYGEWSNPVEKTLVYYEKYQDGSYGYYGVMSDIEAPKTWLLDTLKDKTCVEDGYAVLSEFDLASISYELKVGNMGEAVIIEGEVDRYDVQGSLVFEEYESYDYLQAVLTDKTGGSLAVSNMIYMYKIPYDDAVNTNRTNLDSFYDRIVLSGKNADGKAEFEGFYGRYNPHFAKAAINAIRDIEYSDPTKIYVRSARQLNALGRNPYYWNEFGGLANGEQVTFIQETDINFSTYTKTYNGKVFNLQWFGEPYANRPIGESNYSNRVQNHLTESEKVKKHFRNIYDGRSHKIIDYCVDGGKNTQYVGLFGAISDATLKNIVMVVSSDPEYDNIGLITSKYESKHIWNNDWNYHAVGVGTLVGLAYDQADTHNTIQNCATSGYTVKYDLVKRSDLQLDLGPAIDSNGGTMEPLGIAMGGLVGFSTSNIYNCTAVNDVVLEMWKDYVHTHDNYLRHDEYTGGVVYLGGFAGSHTNGKVDNCYSGGTIDVINNKFSVPSLRIGGFCPGWLDTSIFEAEYTENYDKVTYSNIYSYTKVSDNIWNIPGKKAWNIIDPSTGTGYFDYTTKERFNHYVPLVSTLVEYYDTTRVDNEFWVHDQSIPEDKITFNKNTNFYIDEITSVHINKTPANVKNFYMENSVNKTAQKTTYTGLAEYAHSYKDMAANSYVNGDWDANGNLISSMKSYPYPAVIYNVDENGEKTNDYVHYGEWPSLIDSMFVYYEVYEDESIGYYGVVEDPDSDAIWVLDTLKDEACIEDGYGIVSEYLYDKLSYDLYVANDGKTASKSQTYSGTSDMSEEAVLRFEIYASYDEVNGKPQGEAIGEFSLNNLQNLYMLPFDQQFTSRTGGQAFYDRIVFTATANGATVVDRLNCYYNPLFAKTAISPKEREAYDNPTNVYIRSARQLNALGRNPYFWSWSGYLYGAPKVTFIQESDINFSTYVKNYRGQEYDLQAFGKSYSNHVIGESYGTPFTNIYDGRSNKIIDYCLDGGDDTHFTGLFGEIKNATLKNIVMTVSSDKKGNAGLITSSYRTHHMSNSTPIDRIGIRENRAGVGALLGMANTDSGNSTIDNCMASGYTVKYVLKDRTNLLQPLQNALNQGRGDIIEPLGISIGGLIGYSTDNITNCAAVNDVVIELHKDYQNTFDNYLNRNDANNMYGSGGVVYLGGFVGSHYYGKIDNCYSGGTIDVLDNGYSIPKLRVGGFCPGWMDTPMGENYYRYFGVQYANTYSYTEVSQNIWDVTGEKMWNKDKGVFESTDAKTDTYYVPHVSGMVDYFEVSGRQEFVEYWMHDQSVLGTNAGFYNNSYLLELSVTHMNQVLNDTNALPESFYMVNGNDVTASQITVAELKNNADNGASGVMTYLYGDSALLSKNESYPYQAVVKDVETGKFVHYGDWYRGIDTSNLIARYPAYYEEYADGSFGFVYLKEDGTRVEKLTDDRSKEIVSTGYGYLTVLPEEVQDVQKITAHINGAIYYLDKLTEGEVQQLLNGNDQQEPCQKFEMTYSKPQTDGEEVIKTVTLYMNPKFGAALSATPDLGTESNPLQVRTKEQFQNVGIAGNARYHKQTHDIDLAGGHIMVNIEVGASFYNGSADEGYVIKNVENTLFGRNSGTIENVKVVSFNSTNSYEYAVAGFIQENDGTIRNCSVGIANEESDILIQGKNAYGFAYRNKGTIEGCSVIGKVVATEGEAVGFVGYNSGGTIADCNVRVADDGDGVVVQGTNAYGFVKENDGTITGSYVVGKVIGTEEAAGFVGSNFKTIALCTVGNNDSDVETLAQANKAYGFVAKNMNSFAKIDNCSVVANVAGTEEAAGFVGENSGAITNSAVIGTDSGNANGSIQATNLAVGFVGNNHGTITKSYVRAWHSYEDVVIQGYDAYGFVNENNNLITECFVVGTVKAELTAAGFVGSNNVWKGMNKCYSNANVSVSTTNTSAKASGFAHWSGNNDDDNKWIVNCYAAGSVAGYQTYGFAYSADTDFCYTVVSQDGGVNTYTYRKYGHILVAKGSYIWGYDEFRNYNMKAATGKTNEESARTLAQLDDAATDTDAFAFSTELKGKQYPYETYGLTHYGDWPEATHLNQGYKGDDYLRAGLYYCEEYYNPDTGKITRGVYGVGDYHDKANNRRAIGTTLNTLMQGDAEELKKFVIKRYYGMYYHVDRKNGTICHSDEEWTPYWYYSFNGATQSLFKDLNITEIPAGFSNYRFCQVTEAVGPDETIADSATATIFYKSNTDGGHMDTNYDYLYDQQGDKNGVVSDAEKARGIKLTITLEEIEAARNNSGLERP